MSNSVGKPMLQILDDKDVTFGSGSEQPGTFFILPNTRNRFMRQGIIENHVSDPEGRPTGGNTVGRGFTIAWQNGPLGRGEERLEPNGAFVEDVIDAARGRLMYYQGSAFECGENADAIYHLERALERLESRTKKREDRGVEGTHEV